MATNIQTTGGVSYVEWGSVIAGTVLALAVSVVLVQFSHAVGLSIPERYEGSYTAGKIFTISIWLLWVQLMASMSGGYLAGRLRGPWAGSRADESEMRDGAHGLLVWATSTLIAVAVAAVAAALSAVALHHGVDAAEIAKAKAEAVPEALVKKYGIIFGFGAVASSIVSAVAAYWMGTVGGDHRDGEYDFGRFSFRTNKKRK